MPVLQEVIDLVSRFEENRAAYNSSAYNEAQLRREFIDPLFKALGLPSFLLFTDHKRTRRVTL
ncbi:MAG: hypothetical protein PHP66_03830 [Syntrophales bacterium]|nr:hypothetical protein [Syntrophales bacterium]